MIHWAWLILAFVVGGLIGRWLSGESVWDWADKPIGINAVDEISKITDSWAEDGGYFSIRYNPHVESQPIDDGPVPDTRIDGVE